MTLAVALVALALVLLLGSLLGRVIGSRRWGVPEALLAGVIGLLLGPAGPLPAPLLPASVLRVWEQLPLALLTLVFGTLLVGKPLPRPKGLWNPLAAQVLLALTLAFGQYLVAALVALVLPGMHPLLACLIEVAYEGGHGSAAAMGPTYARLGFSGGEDLGLAMATVGLLSSTVVGGFVVVLARRLGWLQASPKRAGVAAQPHTASAPAAPSGADIGAAVEAAQAPASSEARASAPPADAPGPELSSTGSAPALSPAHQGAQGDARSKAASPSNPADWAVNLALAGLAVAFGWLALEALRALAERLGGGVQIVIEALPVFPLAIVGSLLVRLALERFGQAGRVSGAIQTLVGTLAADLLITAATACLDLGQLAQDWRPLTALALTGLAWNLTVVLVLGRLILPAPWFERGILEFGQATGVAASGLLLLRMADPEDRSDAMPAFSIKQLLLQPFLAGGLITVVAPLLVTRLGLPLWTALCLGLVVLWIGLALALAARMGRPSELV
jgi:ESS family glutamate:Na+ symporter